jgi:lysyl-tRNA synthetase class 2
MLASVLRRALWAVAILAGIVVGIALAASATGVLYALRGTSLPGPVIRDALPLDELPRRDGVPILLFVAVWGVVGLLLGMLARALRAERLTGAALLGLGVWGWTYASVGVSLLVVRQIPAHDAFGAAAHLRSVYLPAALAALAGALVGRTRPKARPRAPLLLAALVAGTGAISVLDGILPARPDTLLAQLSLTRVTPVASALVAPLGLALLVGARGLARRKRRAYHVCLALLIGLAALHELHRFDYGAVAAALVAVVLVARRNVFDAPGDPTASPRLVLRVIGVLTVIYVFGAIVLWTNRIEADQPFTLHFAFTETTEALAGISLGGSQHLADGFGAWFPISVFVAGLAAAGWILASWLGPWRYRQSQEARERELARSLVTAWGVDTLAPFALRGDKSYFFDESERAFIAYRVVRGVVIVSGDPIGPPEQLDGLVASFVRFARRRDWRIAILGASERLLDIYARHGLQALYHGDEAVLDVDAFTLEGRPIRKVRQSVTRLQRAGYRAEVVRPREIDPELRGELEEIARVWRGAEPARGFVMALDALFRLDDDDAVFVVGRDPDGAPMGFLHFAVVQASAALSLSSMPRLRTTPNGFNEWLICETVDWARENGFQRLSLNFAPFAALLAPEAKLSRAQSIERRALLALKGRFQLDNLLLFNRKFFPDWQRRFVVYERRIDLPRIGIAALAAEAYLPFSGRDRE